jgi:acetyltransferase-like isoleucine patch superfamily enzyme
MIGLMLFLSNKIRSICLNREIARLGKMKGLTLGRGVVFHGHPVIDISNGGSVTIENDVVLNSENVGYHLNMHSPIKLFADRPGATIFIGERTRIHGTCLHAYSSIKIGKYCLIAANCQLIDGSGHDLSFDDVDNRINTIGTSNSIILEDSVWLGANVIILPGVTIGKGSVIGAGSVVTKDIPPMVVAAGNPARVIKYAEKL